MLLLGIDIGTSSIKVSVVDAVSKQCIASVSFPEQEVVVDAPQSGWAEQSPDLWWEHVQQAILKCNAKKLYDPKAIKAIGIAYQMHGLVMIDKDKKVLRPSIIWCDSRAVEIGEKAFDSIGHEKSLQHLLNSPGNFTASKLAWVKQNEPDIYNNVWKIGLPGDFIAMKFTGDITTTSSALSEGVFWDFKKAAVSDDVMNHYGFDHSVLPDEHELFSEHGKVTTS
ncbi:MAG: FGGY family carbohydrate kinase, partial [Ginsengibacter sp.]